MKIRAKGNDGGWTVGKGGSFGRLARRLHVEFCRWMAFMRAGQLAPHLIEKAMKDLYLPERN